MKIAISTDGDQVSAHFGRCPAFTILEVDGGNLVSRETVPNPGHHPGFLPEFLHQMGVHCIIAGGMGQKAMTLFDAYGIQSLMGIVGTVDETISQLLSGTLRGGESLCKPGGGKGYGVEKIECDHGGES